MDNIAQYILPNGQLNDRLIERREVLYRGMNGRCVERFTVQGDRSYVFKPLTNPSQKGKEAWIYQHVLPELPPVYPTMLAHSSASADCEGEDWIVFEDVGKLRHRFDEKLLLTATKAMARWHAIPVQRSWEEAGLRGPKPPFSTIATEVLEKEAECYRMMTSDTPLSVNASTNDSDTSWLLVQTVLTDYAAQPSIYQFNDPLVLSHGDLHLGNIAYRESDSPLAKHGACSLEQIIIIDWEHAHLNHRYWDLFHLIDLSHPLYPKSVQPRFRERMLTAYWQEVHAVEREVNGLSLEPQHTYLRRYYLYTTIFSMWMLLLIANDLQRADSIWSKSDLQRQFVETRAVVEQCAERYVQLQ